MTARRPVVVALLCVSLAAGGCATTRYQPRVVARGELTLGYSGGFNMQAGGVTVAEGPTWSGLPDYVRCVPQARSFADGAVTHGRAGLAMQILGATFGVVSLGGLYGVATDNEDLRWPLLGGGVGLALLGLAMAVGSMAERNGASGRAIDAMNLYNDRVGSLGATCSDLTYPYPLAEVPPSP